MKSKDTKRIEAKQRSLEALQQWQKVLAAGTLGNVAPSRSDSAFLQEGTIEQLATRKVAHHTRMIQTLSN